DLFEIRLPQAAARRGRSEFHPVFISRRCGDVQNCDAPEWLRLSSPEMAIYLLAGYAAWIYRMTGSSDLMIGTASAVRGYQELAEPIGPLAQYLPVRCRVEAGATLADLTQQLDHNYREAEAWQESFTWDDVKNASEADSGPLFFPFQFEYREIPEPV